jgi:hypothetical protein
MTRWTKTLVVAVLEEDLHTMAIRLKYSPIAGFRELAFRQPPNRIDSIFYTNPPNSHPLCGSRNFRTIVPIKILGKSEKASAAETQKEFKLVKASCGYAPVPRPANVQYQTAVVL